MTISSSQVMSYIFFYFNKDIFEKHLIWLSDISLVSLLQIYVIFIFILIEPLGKFEGNSGITVVNDDLVIYVTYFLKDANNYLHHYFIASLGFVRYSVKL